jgi:hypothetical protein
MALKACRECGNQVSTEGATCPHCGVKDPTGQLARAKSSTRNGCLLIIVATIGTIVVAGIIGQSVKTDEKQSSSENQTSNSSSGRCNSDWKLCSDNSDLVNHWFGWFRVQRECKDEAERRSKYGTPEWPWFAFGKFRRGKSYVDSGIAVAFEDGAKFSNGFGAMVKVDLACTYDLNNNTVTDVSIIEH